jgi:hypothetical protein
LDDPAPIMLLPPPRRALQPKVKARTPMAIQVSRCDVLVQVVGARNVPLRVEMSDERVGAAVAAIGRGGSPNRASISRGQPADNAPDLTYFADAITSAVAEECAAADIPVPVLAFEPGRYIAGPAGITLYNVGTIKDVRITDGSEPAVRKYVSVDGGMSDNARPALYEAEYHVALANRTTTADPSLVRVVGKHCESGDIVVRHDYLPSDVKPNDLLAVATTGAYCYSLSSNYNFMTRPAVVAVRAGVARLVVEGQTEADLFTKDVRYQQLRGNSDTGKE